MHRMLLVVSGLLYAASLLVVPVAGAALGNSLFQVPLLCAVVVLAFGGPLAAQAATAQMLPLLLLGMAMAAAIFAVFVATNIFAVLALIRGGRSPNRRSVHIGYAVCWSCLALIAVATATLNFCSSLWLLASGGIWLATELNRRSVIAPAAALPAVPVDV